MSRNYDNWERLVAAVLRRELIWKICHEDSPTPSPRSSVSSNQSSSFRSSSSSSNAPFDFVDRKDALFFKSPMSRPFGYFAGIKIGVKKSETKNEILHFKGNDSFVFSLHELLMAPSVALGEVIEARMKTYVVELKEDVEFVVKKLERGNNFTRVKFQKVVKMLLSMEHENVVKLRGCYKSSNESRLGFFDYFWPGSVHTLLHVKGDNKWVPSDWETRIRIAIGAARGLAHIHRQCGGKLVHGNIKSSNVFINSQGYGCLSDLNLKNLMNPNKPTVKTNGGFTAPVNKGNVSQACDVYSFGVFLLELLTGKPPINHRIGGYVSLVRFIVRDEWMLVVYDMGLLKISKIKDEMQGMLHLGLACVEDDPGERINMENVVKMLEHLRSDE